MAVAGAIVVVVGITMSQRLPVRPGVHVQVGRASALAPSLQMPPAKQYVRHTTIKHRLNV